MIIKTIQLGSRLLFAERSENADDDARLATLVRESKHFQIASLKTGLLVALEHEASGNRIVVFCLRKPVQLSDGEVTFLKKTTEEMKGINEAKI